MNDFKFRYKFVESLYSLIKNNVNIIDAIKIIEKTFRNKEREKILKLKKSLELGKPFELAFKNISDDLEFVFFMSTAQKTGDLEKILSLLLEKYELYDKSKREIQNLLLYPSILLIIVSLVSYIILVNIIPEFVEIYKELNQQLPSITIFIINSSSFIIRNKLYIILILLLIIFNFYMILKYNYLKIEKILYNISFYRNIKLLNFTKAVSICLYSKIELVEALKLFSKSKKSYFNNELKYIIKKLERGINLNDCFSNNLIFDNEFRNYIIIAEKTGQMEVSFNQLASIYSTRVENSIKFFTKLIEPVSIVVISAIIGILAISIMLPLFSIKF